MNGNDVKKKAPVVISWALILAALGIGITAMSSANELENLALANEKDIFYEREQRIIGAEVLEKDIEDLSEDVNELKQDLKEETGEIKELLNQLLLRQVLESNN